MHEVAGFLRGFPPFDRATEEQLAPLLAATEIEYFPAAAFLLQASAAPPEHVHVVRTGYVELLDSGRVIDVLGPGEMVGLPALVSGLPSGLDARAAEEVLTYRIPAAALLPLLSGRSGLRFLARTVREQTPQLLPEAVGEAAEERVGDLVRPIVVVDADASVESALEDMQRSDASCVLVSDRHGQLGIITDKDLRSRVLAPGRPVGDPVRSVMTTPVRSVTPTTTVEDAILLMLMHAIRHLPVLRSDGTAHGVVEDVDLLAAQNRTPVQLRRSIGRAASADQLVTASAGIEASMVAAVRAGRSARSTTLSLSVLREAVLTKAIEFALAQRGEPPAPFALALTGSVARGEAVFASDLDTLMAWDGPDDDPAVRAWMCSLARDVLAVCAACGLTSDENGIRADDPRFARSVRNWCETIREWASDPAASQASIYLAAITDTRPVWGQAVWQEVQAAAQAQAGSPLVRRAFHRVAVSQRPPTGFGRAFVIEGSGEHAGTLDLKRGGLRPIATLGRYLALLGSGHRLATTQRIESAEALGLLSGEDSHDLVDAFDIVQNTRLEHQVAQLAQALAPDEHVDPNALTPWRKRELKEAFRAIRRVQQRLPPPEADS